MRRVLTAPFPILLLFPHAAAAPRPKGFEAVGFGGGPTFREFLDVPFLSTNRVMVDAAGQQLFVCTYGGGVWRGRLPD